MAASTNEVAGEISTAVAAVVKANDRMLRDVIAETPAEDRGKLMTICSNSIPDKLFFIEGFILISALSTMGFVDLHNVTNDIIEFENQQIDMMGFLIHLDNYRFECTIDDDGRIKKLSIVGDKGSDEPFALPAIICRLEKLTDLELQYCRSLPVELSNLPHLQSLKLVHCSDLFDSNFPVQMELSNLKNFFIDDCYQIQSSSSLFLEWLTKQLPYLETLGFDKTKKKGTNSILNFLRTVKYLCFQNTSKSLTMRSCNIDLKNF
ncbi:MAG: hypothetical protein ACI8RD_013795 [Bacillariaceae sp.]|jgi:hypothetical protein